MLRTTRACSSRCYPGDADGRNRARLRSTRRVGGCLLDTDELLKNLTDPQREAVTHADGPLLVLAGPGSGKTRVITHRAAYLACTVTRGWHILAITFTNKAANEMAERMRRLEVAGVTCSTFHSFCARLLRIHGRQAGLQPNFSIFDDSDQESAMKQALQRVNLSADNFTPGNMLHTISRAKNDMLTPDEYESRGGGWLDKAVARVYREYEKVLAEQNALDFDDLLLKTAWMLRDHSDIREQLEERYRYVLVDEYQDTNHAQYMIARLLAMRRENLCVTGDPDQSIYAWRGANLHNILQFEEDFPTARVVRLEQNYRSTPEILAAADAVIAHNKKRKKKALWTHNPGGAQITVAECEDSHAEAAFLASQIRRYVADGGRYGDMAVFYRTNALSRNIEAGLRGAQIPYQVARGVAFYHRKEIRDVLAYLKLVANPLDRVSFERIVNTPPRGLGKTTVERVIAYAESTKQTALEAIREPEQIPDAGRAVRALKNFSELMDTIAALAGRGSIQDTIEYAVQHSGLRAMWYQAQDESALENVDELINAAAEYDRVHDGETGPPILDTPVSSAASGSVPDLREVAGVSRLTEWLTQVSLVSDVDAIDPEVGAVTMMTLHAAKGLEFDFVLMAGLEEGLLPHQRSQIERADVEEERRLCFVGMTRARKSLTMSCARWRDLRGVRQRTSRSRFLAELPREGVNWVSVGEDGEPLSGLDDEEQEAGEPQLGCRDWRRGQYVRHPQYGIGRVLWIEPRNRKTHAGIAFAAYGQKTFILEHSQLEIVEPDELY